jgi:glutaredoxin
MTNYIITTSNCHACEVLKNKMKRNGIPFKAIDFNSNDAKDLISKYKLMPAIRGFPFFFKVNGSDKVLNCFCGFVDNQDYWEKVK